MKKNNTNLANRLRNFDIELSNIGPEPSRKKKRTGSSPADLYLEKQSDLLKMRANAVERKRKAMTEAVNKKRKSPVNDLPSKKKRTGPSSVELNVLMDNAFKRANHGDQKRLKR